MPSKAEDAETLRQAAVVLARRAKRRTFPLLVMIKALEASANRLDKSDVWRDFARHPRRC